MSIEIAYYLLVMLIGYTGFVLIKKSALNFGLAEMLRLQKNRYKDIKNFVSGHRDFQPDSLFQGTGLNFTKAGYNAARNSIFAVLIGAAAVEHFLTGKNILPLLAVYAVLYVLTDSKEYFLGKKTPFFLAAELLKNDYKSKKDDELYKVIAQLKNFAIAQKDKPWSGEFIIRHIMRFTTITKPVFSQTLALWRLGREKEAASFLADAFDTRLGKEFSNIIIKLDSINPAELTDQLTLLQEHIDEEKMTKRLKRQELISNLIFMPVAAAALIIILNFVVIVIWLDSIQTLINY